MVITHDVPGESLPQFVARETRAASDLLLAACGIIGVSIASAVLYLRPPAWPVFTAAGIMLLCLGGWGVVDRELSEFEANGHAPHPPLRATRALFAIAGWLSMLATIFGMLGVALGTIIS